MSTMNVCIDNQIFGVQRFGGIARYWCELIPRLAQEPNIHLEVDLGWYITQYGLAEALQNQASVALSGRPAPTWIPNAVRKIRNAVAARCQPAVASGSILHSTYYYNFRRRRSGSYRVVTFFDLIQERYRRPGDERVIAAKREAAANADLLLCISQATADDLCEIYQVKPERVAVTHLGFVAQTGEALETSPHDRPYVLFVGLRDGYKNFALAKQAYEASAEVHRNLDFVCFGGPPLSNEEIASVTGGRMIWRSGSDMELARHYRHATALLYTSRYEGFGLPIVEAMSQGCPVITTRGGSLAEIGGEAADYVDPDDAEGLAAAILATLPGTEHRAQRVAAGKDRARTFTWEATATTTMAAYRRLTGVG